MSKGAIAAVSCALAGIATVPLTVVLPPVYGFSLFVVFPFIIGLVTAAAGSLDPGATLLGALRRSLLSLALVGLGLLVIRIEGAICIVMAFPIAAVLCALGAVAGHYLVRGRRTVTPLILISALATPSLNAIEMAVNLAAPLLRVESAIEIDAPPSAVWKNVVEFAQLPPPTEWIFRTGIAYPVRATIQGDSAGAIRKCEFTTGPFVEPIEVWDAPRLLRFGVTHNPAPMEEWTPYGSIHPPHLKGFLVSERGQFELVALPGARTLLKGTTWYRHNMRPATYWQWWSDAIIHRIHMRVLRHVKNLSENQRAGLTVSPAFSGLSTGSATRSPSARP